MNERTPSPIRILVAAESRTDADSLKLRLNACGFADLTVAASYEQACASIAADDFSIIIGLASELNAETISLFADSLTDGKPVPVLLLSPTHSLPVTRRRSGGLLRVLPADAGNDLLSLAVELLAFSGSGHLLWGNYEQKPQKPDEVTIESIRHSDALFRSIVDTAPSLLAISDLNGVFIYFSPNCLSFTGYSQKELLEEHVWYVHEDDSERIKSIYLQNVLNCTSGRNIEYRAVKKNGDTWYASTSWEPIKDELGVAMGFIVQTTDITERKSAEKALRESEELFRMMVESSPGSIMIIENGTFIYANPTAVAMFDYTDMSELIGRNAMDFVAPESRPDARERIRLAAMGLPNGLKEMILLRRNGKKINVFSTTVPGKLNGRQVMIVLGYDISNLKETENALEKSRFALTKAQKLAHLGNYSWDTKTGEATWSEEVYSIFGCEGMNPSHELVLSLMVPEDRQRAIENAVLHRNLHQPVKIDYRIIRPDGSLRYIQDLAEVEYGEDNQPVRVFGTVLDITDRKAAEEALRESELKYRTLVDNLPDIVIRFDREATVLYNNDVGKSLQESLTDTCGKDTSDELTCNQPLLEFLKPKIADVIDNGSSFEGMYENDMLAIEWRIMPEIDAAGSTVSALAIGRNLTDQRRAEVDYSVLFNQMLDGFSLHEIILNPNGDPVDYRFLKVNPSFEKMTGLSAQNIVGKTVHEVLPLTEQYWIDTYGHVALTGEPVIFEDYSGELNKYFEVYAYSPRQNQFAVIVRDITDRKHIESELHKRESWLSSILMASPVGIGVNHNRIIKMVNDRICEMTGYSRDELIEKNALMLYPSIDEYDYVGREKYRQIKETGIGTVETKWKCKDGNIIDILLSSSYIDPQYHDAGVTFTALDITESKSFLRALRESEMRFRALFEHSPVGVAITDTEGYCMLSNDTLRAMFGYTAEELASIRLSDIAHPDDIDIIVSVYRKFANGSFDRQVIELRYLNRQKKSVWVNQAVSVTVKDDGSLENIIGIFADITSRKELETQLRQSQKMEAIGTLAGGIAHDFNNILSIITGYSELVLDELHEEDPVAKDVTEIMRASTRARELVSQILTISRQQKEEKKPLQLNVIVKETVKFLRASLPATIEIRHSIEPDIPYILADPVQMHQVLMNLCTNASHAMKEKGGILDITLIRVCLDSDFTAKYPEIEPGGYVRLSVRDTGKGINPDLLDRIFEPYFTTKEKGEGTGLGLAVVHGIVHNCKGLITVESTIGVGTHFHVYFPAIEGLVLVEAEGSNSCIGGSECILFVDDEPMIVATEERKLCRLGYNVTVETGSLDALEHIRRSPDAFDLVITDMTMPGMTGLELAREIEALRPDIPVIICSGYHDALISGRIDQQNVKAVLAKPVSTKKIAEAIRSALDKQQ